MPTTFEFPIKIHVLSPFSVCLQNGRPFALPAKRPEKRSTQNSGTPKMVVVFLISLQHTLTKNKHQPQLDPRSRPEPRPARLAREFLDAPLHLGSRQVPQDVVLVASHLGLKTNMNKVPKDKSKHHLLDKGILQIGWCTRCLTR